MCPLWTWFYGTKAVVSKKSSDSKFARGSTRIALQEWTSFSNYVVKYNKHILTLFKNSVLSHCDKSEYPT